MTMIELEQVVNGKVQKTKLPGRVWDHMQRQVIHCPGSFEDRFYDPDHPKDSDWVADINNGSLFQHSRFGRSEPRLPR